MAGKVPNCTSQVLCHLIALPRNGRDVIGVWAVDCGVNRWASPVLTVVPHEDEAQR